MDDDSCGCVSVCKCFLSWLAGQGGGEGGCDVKHACASMCSDSADADGLEACAARARRNSSVTLLSLSHRFT